MNDPRTPSRYFVSRKKVNPYARQIANEIFEGDAYLELNSNVVMLVMKSFHPFLPLL